MSKKNPYSILKYIFDTNSLPFILTYSAKTLILSLAFEECFNTLLKNESFKTIIPVENLIAGRVADIHI